MMSLQVSYYIKKPDFDNFMTALRPAWEAVSKEENFRFFDVFTATDPTDPDVEILRFVEVWDCTSEWFMQNQITKEYYQPYFEATKDMHARERSFDITERKAGWCAVRQEYLEGVTRV